MGLEGEPVHRLAADVPPVGDGLGGQTLMDEVESLVHGRSVGVARPVFGGRADGHPAHGLHTAGDDHVHGPGHHRLGGEVDRLLGRAALAVDGGARARCRESRRPAPRCGRCSWPAPPPSWCSRRRRPRPGRGRGRSARGGHRRGWAARSTACQPERRPFLLPTGVRTTSTITAFGMLLIVADRAWLPEIWRCVRFRVRRRTTFDPTMDTPMDLRRHPGPGGLPP